MKKQKRYLLLILTALLVMVGGIAQARTNSSSSSSKLTVVQKNTKKGYKPSQAEKTQLKEKFSELKTKNPDTIAYIYAPKTKLDEPVVQTTDNATYLDRTFDGAYEPFMGTVFMDKNNNSDFNDNLTWLFGHARGSQVPDNRMFNDVNFYDTQSYFDQHPYLVVETPERKYYYEAAFFIIVPETTAFYRTSFESAEQFEEQLTAVRKDATTQNKSIEVNSKDKYLVLSTCREEDPSIRANLYLRQIPNEELSDFLEKNEKDLVYQPTR